MITLTSGTLSVQLRNPDFGDKEVVESRRISRKTRGGDMVMFRDPAWPQFATYTWKWSFLKQSDLYALLHFLRETLGQEVQITHYEGMVLEGIITTPAEEVSQDGIENYRAGFSFEVEL